MKPPPQPPCRKRVFDALAFEPPDIVPVEFHLSPAGMYEHGRDLQELMCRFGHDFGDASLFGIPRPEPEDFDDDGQYHAIRTDAWGAVWDYRIFGVSGHPVERPLDDWGNWDRFAPPPAPAMSGLAFEADCAFVREHRSRFFLKSGWVSLFEVMHGVRRFEDVLMDLALDDPRIHRLADTIAEYHVKQVEHLLLRGVDAVQFADDFGTQTDLILSRECFRRFFAPRYRRLIEPVKAAGAKAFFHSCGQMGELLEDLAEIGFDAVWLQAPLFDARDLAQRLGGLGMAAAIHPDRSHLMTTGSPEQVRRTVLDLAEAFDVGRGGSWFYVEIDNGFRFDNVRALIETIGELRGQR